MVQLAITCAGVAGLYVSKDWNLIFKRYEAMLMIPSIVVAVVIMCGIACCKTCSRKVPMNYICLLVYTLAITLLVMAVAGKYNPESVLKWYESVKLIEVFTLRIDDGFRDFWDCDDGVRT